jgi:uncharacterized protein involved in exopolysaccharide biosynthesis
MNSIVTTGVSRRELMIFFFKFRTRLVMAFLIPFALSVGVSTLPVPRYKAESVMVVRLGSEYVYQPEVGTTQTGSNPTIPFDREQIFKSEVAIMGSNDLHKEVIKTVGLGKIFPEIITPTPFSHVKTFIMGGFVAALTSSENVPDDLEQYRLAKAVEVFGKRFDILLEKESAVITVSFEHRDRAIATETLQTLLNLYFEKRKKLYLEPRAELAESQMHAARSQALEAQKAVESFKLKHQLYSLEEQRRQLLDKRNDAERRATSINSPSLTKEITAYNAALAALDRQEREFLGLQKEAELANESYSLSSHRYEEAKAYEEVQRDRASSVRIIQPPSAPPEPKKLNSLIMLAGTVLSILIALIVAAISEFSRRGFLTPEEAERQLKLPVLAVLPYISHP